MSYGKMIVHGLLRLGLIAGVALSVLLYVLWRLIQHLRLEWVA